jgi:hypothetical protein
MIRNYGIPKEPVVRLSQLFMATLFRFLSFLVVIVVELLYSYQFQLTSFDTMINSFFE